MIYLVLLLFSITVPIRYRLLGSVPNWPLVAIGENALNIDSIFIKEALVGEIITLQRILKDNGYSPDTMDPDNMSYIKNSLKTNTSIYVLRERLSHLEVSVSEYNKRDEERTPEDKQKAIEEATLAWVARSGGTLQQRRR